MSFERKPVIRSGAAVAFAGTRSDGVTNQQPSVGLAAWVIDPSWVATVFGFFLIDSAPSKIAPFASKVVFFPQTDSLDIGVIGRNGTKCGGGTCQFATCLTQGTTPHVFRVTGKLSAIT